jgi:aryl-phospho-beta-D-glucosidase BglC (GH1 family)
MRRVLLAVTTAVVAVAASFVIVRSSEAAIVGTPTTLVSKASNRCLTIDGNVVTDGRRAVVYDCNGSATQKWTLTTANELRVTNGGTTKCLDLDQANRRVVLWSCHGGTNQKWTLEANGQVKSQRNGQCLDVTGGGNSPNNTPVVPWTCSATATHQVWTQGTPPPTGSTPVARNGQLKIVGTQVLNQSGQAVQLRGMSTHGIQWYWQCVNNASLDALAKDWLADVLRVSMYVQEGGYETDPAGFTAKVQQAIQMVSDRGMYVVVDFHQLNPGDPNYNLANAKKFFTDIANANKNRNNIIYEIANEPNNVSWSAIKSYAEQVIPVIRAIDGDAPILVGTHGWGSLGISDGRNESDVINNKVNASNIAYTFHFYAASHNDQYLNALRNAANQIPMWVSEFGSQTASGDGGNNFAQTQKYIDLMREKKISWTNWNYSDDFRTGAVWNTGTCGGSDYSAGRLKEAGKWIRDRIRENR